MKMNGSFHSSSKYIDEDSWLYKLVAYNNLPALSVTQKIKTIKNNFLLISDFSRNELVLNDDNNIVAMYENKKDTEYARSIGLIVDYLNRFYWTKDIYKSFDISITGFNDCLTSYNIKNKNYVNEKLNLIESNFNKNKKFDENSIQNAYQIVRFDAMYRAKYFDKEWLSKNKITDLKDMPSYLAKNVLNILNRLIKFVETLRDTTFYLTFKNLKDNNLKHEYGYSFFISSGDADFCDEDTLYDIKCSKNPPTNNDILQLIVYFILSKHSEQKIYQNLKFIAIVNPVLNNIWRYEVSKLDINLYKELEKNFLGFNFDIKKDKLWLDNLKTNREIINLIKKICNELEIKTYSKIVEA